jgi:hypothetical protein
MENESGDRLVGRLRRRILLRNSFYPLLLCAAVFAQDAPNGGFRSLRVDAGKVIGEIRSFQGVNGPPSPLMAGLPSLVQQY